MRALAVLLAILAACSNKPSPVTKNFTRRRVIDAWLEKWCHSSLPNYQIEDFSAPQDWGRTIVYACRFSKELGIDTAPIRVTGWLMQPAHGGNDICSIQIGPARTNGDPSLAWVPELFLDPDLGDRVREALTTPAYGGRSVRRLIAGVYVHFDSGRFLLLLNGCGRLPLPADRERDSTTPALDDAGTGDGGAP